MNRQGTVYTVVFSFIVTFAFVFLLALTNQATIGKVKLNQEVARQSAILSALGIDYASQQDVLKKFKDVKTITKNGVTLYETERNGEKLYASEFAGAGLWSTIRGVLGVNANMTRVLGLQIISQGETPGLGGRIDEPWFKKQFSNEKIINNEIKLNMHESGTADTNHDNGQIDGITGATITSTSIERIINNELKILRTALGGNS